MNPKGLQTLRSRLLEAHRVLLAAPLGRDGDDLGSLVGLHRALERLGKDPVAWSPAPVPLPLRELLPDGARILQVLPEGPFDALLCLGCPDPGLLPEELLARTRGIPLLNLDRDPENPGYGDAAWIEPGAAALGEMVLDLVEALEVPLDRDLAVALYFAILAATRSFQHRSVTPGTHRRVARLLAHPVPTDSMARRLFREEDFEALRRMGLVLGRLQVGLGGRIAWSELRARDVDGPALGREDVGPLVERLGQVRGGAVSLLFLEQGPERVEVIVGSRCVPLHGLAERYGGQRRGRELGLLLELPLEEARRELFRELERQLEPLDGPSPDRSAAPA